MAECFLGGFGGKQVYSINGSSYTDRTVLTWSKNTPQTISMPQGTFVYARVVGGQDIQYHWYSNGYRGYGTVTTKDKEIIRGVKTDVGSSTDMFITINSQSAKLTEDITGFEYISSGILKIEVFSLND